MAKLSINKKKTISKKLTGYLKSESSLSKRTKTSTLPPIAMELIRLDKQKIEIIANAIINILSKQIRQIID